MSRWKRAAAVLAVVALAAGGVGGCGGKARKGKGSDLYRVFTVDVNGTKVPCVMTHKGGVTCAWEDR